VGKGVNSSSISAESGRASHVPAIIVNATHHILGINSDDALVAKFSCAGIRDAY
jgi:hypothetical protein